MNEIKTALEQLWKQNEREYHGGVIEQVIFPPDGTKGAFVPTLQQDCKKPMSEMLRTRFEFGGNWINAAFGQTWLGLAEMGALWRNDVILAALESDRKYFDGHVLQVTPWEKLSLFGIDLDDGSKTFIEWSDETETEPHIVTYVGYSVFRYPNLQTSIEALLKSDIV